MALEIIRWRSWGGTARRRRDSLPSRCVPKSQVADTTFCDTAIGSLLHQWRWFDCIVLLKCSRIICKLIFVMIVWFPQCIWLKNTYIVTITIFLSVTPLLKKKEWFQLFQTIQQHAFLSWLSFHEIYKMQSLRKLPFPSRTTAALFEISPTPSSTGDHYRHVMTHNWPLCYIQRAILRRMPLPHCSRSVARMNWRLHSGRSGVWQVDSIIKKN